MRVCSGFVLVRRAEREHSRRTRAKQRLAGLGTHTETHAPPQSLSRCTQSTFPTVQKTLPTSRNRLGSAQTPSTNSNRSAGTSTDSQRREQVHFCKCYAGRQCSCRNIPQINMPTPTLPIISRVDTILWAEGLRPLAHDGGRNWQGGLISKDVYRSYLVASGKQGHPRRLIKGTLVTTRDRQP